MKKIYLILIALVTLSSLQSCEKENKPLGIPGVFELCFYVKHNSELYKDLKNAFAKNDYTHQTNVYDPNLDLGFNNVYFLVGDKKVKLKASLCDRPAKHITKYPKGYAFMSIDNPILFEEVLTGKEERFGLVYDNKKIALKIKGTFDKYHTAVGTVEYFYVNGKKQKNEKSGRYTVRVYLE